MYTPPCSCEHALYILSTPTDVTVSCIHLNVVYAGVNVDNIGVTGCDVVEMVESSQKLRRLGCCIKTKTHSLPNLTACGLTYTTVLPLSLPAVAFPLGKAHFCRCFTEAGISHFPCKKSGTKGAVPMILDTGMTSSCGPSLS